MSIEWFRDLALSILGIGVTAAVIFIGILIFILYRKVSTIIDSVKATSKTIRNISSSVEEEIVSPLTQITALLQGASHVIGLFSRFSKRKKGDG